MRAISPDTGGKAGYGPVELGAPVTSCHVGLGQLGPARRTGTVAQESVGLDGEGQPAKRGRHRADRVRIIGLRSTVGRCLEGGGRPFDLETHVGAQLIVVGLGISGQEGVPGQAGVAQRGQDHPTPRALAGACSADDEEHRDHDDGEYEDHD